MADFLMGNGGTILIGLVLVLVVGLIVRKMVRDRKAGKGGCGCGCGCSTCNMVCFGKKDGCGL